MKIVFEPATFHLLKYSTFKVRFFALFSNKMRVTLYIVLIIFFLPSPAVCDPEGRLPLSRRRGGGGVHHGGDGEGPGGHLGAGGGRGGRAGTIHRRLIDCSIN